MKPIASGNSLEPHPDTPAKDVPAVSCSWVWRSATEWAFDFIVGVPPAKLALPAPGEPGRTDRLSDHTRFALYLMDPETGSRCEFEFSPSGQWTADAVDAGGEGGGELTLQRPARVLSTEPGQLALAMRAELHALGLDEDAIRQLDEAAQPLEEPRQFALSAVMDNPAPNDGRCWLAGLSAVIEEVDGTRSYWALAHPAGCPDLRHPDCFVLELPPAS